MKNYEEMLREFHEKYGHWVGHAVGEPPDKIKIARLRLMMEELGELATEIHENNLVEIADGLCDLVYVAIGTAISYGIPFDACFREVHASNMTKTVHRHDASLGLKYGAKTAKGPDYRPPNLRPLLGLPED